MIMLLINSNRGLCRVGVVRAGNCTLLGGFADVAALRYRRGLAASAPPSEPPDRVAVHDAAHLLLIPADADVYQLRGTVGPNVHVQELEDADQFDQPNNVYFFIAAMADQIRKPD